MIENTITSFSNKRRMPEAKMAIGNIGTGNIPTLATIDMFDCRAMPNPYWNESLRGYSGRDKPIADFFARIPARSVYFAERMSERLLGINGVEVEVTHAARQHWNVKTKEEYDGEC